MTASESVISRSSVFTLIIFSKLKKMPIAPIAINSKVRLKYMQQGLLTCMSVSHISFANEILNSSNSVSTVASSGFLNPFRPIVFYFLRKIDYFLSIMLEPDFDSLNSL